MAPRPDKRRTSTRAFVRTNHKIRVTQVRCVDVGGEALGVMSTRDARALAQKVGLDLVEISPNADPPVCRIMDFGKYRYDESRKERMARKHQHHQAVKEIKFRANVGEHDYETKLNHVRGFLEKGHKVKVSLQFRGRENAHRELGFQLVQRVLAECEDLAQVDQAPRLMGRTIVSMISAKSGKS